MKNSLAIFTLLPLAPSSAAAEGKVPVRQQDKPLNIVYIMTDDHSYQTISCYDNRYIHTPNLDRMAADGVKFTNSFVCNSISGPSRAVLLTGKHSHKNGMVDNSTTFDGSQQTFPKLLQKAGYETGIVGKWHLGGTPTGFDFWEILPGQGSYYNPDFITPEGKEHNEGYVTDIITDKSIDWLENRDKNKPFCLLVHHKAVHRVWAGDTAHLAMFEDRTFPLPENFRDDYAGRQAAAEQKMSIDKDMDLAYDLKMKDRTVKSRFSSPYIEYYRMNDAQKKAWDAVYQPITDEFIASGLSGQELVDWKYQRYMRDYLKCVQSLDENIGRLLDYLEQEGLLENTVVVYASDQGFYMGEHGWFDKRFMYEESLRTPLIMRLPDGMRHGKKEIGQMVQNIDYAPTFLDLAGVAVPDDMQGVSLLPLLEGKKPKEWRKSLYYHYYEFPDEHNVHRHYGVRTERYKLIHFYRDGIDTWELFDLKHDPAEMHNLYGNEKYGSVQRELHEELNRLQKQYDDPILQ